MLYLEAAILLVSATGSTVFVFRGTEVTESSFLTGLDSLNPSNLVDCTGRRTQQTKQKLLNRVNSSPESYTKTTAPHSEAKFLAPDWGIRSTLAQGCRSGLPGCIG
jgi:hypothetical protein